MLKKLRIPIIAFIIAFVLLPIRVTDIEAASSTAKATHWEWLGGAKMLVYSWQHVPQPGGVATDTLPYDIHFQSNFILLCILSLLAVGVVIALARLSFWKKTGGTITPSESSFH